MDIRLGTPADIPAIMAIVRLVVPPMIASGNLQWDDTYPNERVFQHDIDVSELWIVEHNGKVAGFAAITTDQVPEYVQVGWDLDEPSIVIHRLAITPEARGKELARSLMEQAERIAREQDISVLRVDTAAQNAATQRLFPKLGYLLAGEITLAFRPGLRVLCYEKRLNLV